MSPSPCWTLRRDEEMLKMFGPEGPSVAAVVGVFTDAHLPAAAVERSKVAIPSSWSACSRTPAELRS